MISHLLNTKLPHNNCINMIITIYQKWKVILPDQRDVGTRNKDEASCITLVGGDLFDRRGLREQAKGPGKLSKALEIDSSYDNAPINFGQLWIGGEPIDEDQILKRNKSNVPENCVGYFYFR